MQTALTCKEALSIVQVEAADTIASTTRKGNQKKRVANPLPIQSSPPCERTPKLCTHSQERRQTLQNYKQIEQKNPENPVTRMRTSSHPPTLHEASTNPLLEFEIRCAISSASNRTEVGKGKKDRPSPRLDKLK